MIDSVIVFIISSKVKYYSIRDLRLNIFFILFKEFLCAVYQFTCMFLFIILKQKDPLIQLIFTSDSVCVGAFEVDVVLKILLWQ